MSTSSSRAAATSWRDLSEEELKRTVLYTCWWHRDTHSGMPSWVVNHAYSWTQEQWNKPPLVMKTSNQLLETLAAAIKSDPWTPQQILTMRTLYPTEEALLDAWSKYIESKARTILNDKAFQGCRVMWTDPDTEPGKTSRERVTQAAQVGVLPTPVWIVSQSTQARNCEGPAKEIYPYLMLKCKKNATLSDAIPTWVSRDFHTRRRYQQGPDATERLAQLEKALYEKTRKSVWPDVMKEHWTPTSTLQDGLVHWRAFVACTLFGERNVTPDLNVLAVSMMLNENGRSLARQETETWNTHHRGKRQLRRRAYTVLPLHSFWHPQRQIPASQAAQQSSNEEAERQKMEQEEARQAEEAEEAELQQIGDVDGDDQDDDGEDLADEAEGLTAVTEEPDVEEEGVVRDLEEVIGEDEEEGRDVEEEGDEEEEPDEGQADARSDDGREV